VIRLSLPLIAAVAAIAGGAGKVSIDAAFGKAKWGAKGTLFALAAGALGSLAVVKLGQLNAPAVEADAAASTGDTAPNDEA
jgi:putative oxidoreductase